MNTLVEPGAELDRLFTGAEWVEGPAWLPATRRVRFSDIPGDRILEYDTRPRGARRCTVPGSGSSTDAPWTSDSGWSSARTACAVALVQFFLVWNDLLFAITFANRRELNTIQAGLLNFSGEYGALDYGPLMAAICITVTGVLVLYLFLNQRIMQGLTAGSIKG